MINWYGKEILKNEEKNNTNIYLNTELSKDEVTSIIKKFMLSKNLSMYEVTTCKSENYDEYAIYLKFYNDRAFIDFSTHISSEGGTTTYSIFVSTEGWAPEALATKPFLSNVSIAQTSFPSSSPDELFNNELTQLLSSVPFVKGEEYNFVEISASSGSGTDMLQARVDSNNSCQYLFYHYGGSNVDFISGLDTSRVIDMSHMFRGCKALTTIPLLDTSNVTGMNYMFYDCSKLTTIPQLDTSNVTNMNNMFRGCKSLITIDITHYNISSTTNVSYFVQNCSALKSLIIRSFGTSYILDTSSLKTIGITNGTGYIYVPRNMVDTLKSATNWSTYASQIRALEDYTIDGTTTGALDESKI